MPSIPGLAYHEVLHGRCALGNLTAVTWCASSQFFLVHPSYNPTNRAETILNSLLYLRVDKQVDMLRCSQITYAHVPAFICTNRRKYDPKGAPLEDSAQNGSKWISLMHTVLT